MRVEGQWLGLQIGILLRAVIRSSTWHQEARAHTSTAAGHASVLSSIRFVRSSGVLSQCRCRCQWWGHTVLTAPEHLTTQTSAGMRFMPAHEMPRQLIRRRCSLLLWNAGHRVACAGQSRHPLLERKHAWKSTRMASSAASRLGSRQSH